MSSFHNRVIRIAICLFSLTALQSCRSAQSQIVGMWAEMKRTVIHNDGRIEALAHDDKIRLSFFDRDGRTVDYELKPGCCFIAMEGKYFLRGEELMVVDDDGHWRFVIGVRYRIEDNQLILESPSQNNDRFLQIVYRRLE